MKAETAIHLRVAEGNRDPAIAVLGSPGSAMPRRWEWSGLAAFYAAVHHVNAYLWEASGFAPADHAERRRAIGGDGLLRSIREHDRFLQVYGFGARYDPRFEADEFVAKDALDIDLRAIEAAVLRALGLAVPAWRLPEQG